MLQAPRNAQKGTLHAEQIRLTPRRKIHTLNRIPPIPHRHRRHRRLLKHHRPRMRLGHRLRLPLGNPHTHRRAIKSQEIQRLRIRLVIRSAHYHRAGAQPTRRLDHLLRHALVVALRDVDEVLSAAVARQLLLVARVQADDAHRHAPARELARDVPEAAAGAGDDDPLSGFGAGFAERGVGGYAGAEHGLAIFHVSTWGSGMEGRGALQLRQRNRVRRGWASRS